MVKTLCVIGVGLIGGSLALGLRSKNWCQSIIGIDANQDALDKAIALNIIDEGYTSIAQCQHVPDVVVIAVPVLKVAKVFEDLKPWLSQCNAVTDVSSTKTSVINDYKKIYPGESASCFVPGHPIAGREQSGVEAAIENLFQQRKVILTPMESSHNESVNLITQMWQQLGAHVEHLSAEDHDQILAATSHLPHALAYSLVHCLSTQSHTDEIFRYAAGGFADFTRIASSDPIVWREICLANRDELLKALDHFDVSLQHMRESLSSADGDALEEIFTAAKSARDRYTDS